MPCSQHARDLAAFDQIASLAGGTLRACDVLGVSYESVKGWRRGPEDRTGRAFPDYIRRSMLAHLALAGLVDYNPLAAPEGS